MDPEGLFDFLEPTSSKALGQTSSNLNGKAAAASSTRPSKRASSPTADRPSSPPPATKNKRPRVVPPPTVVTDEFTAEATRHVPVADGAAADVAQSVKSQDENGSTDATKNGQADSSTGAGTIVTSTAKAALSLTHSVRHQVAIPPSYDYKPLSSHVPPADPARTWPFTLDPFQRTSISCIERNESVLVSAHTSAGKTVVAEYAIAQALRNGQRVVYTSPIKALSNQKYREMSAEFGDVGLMTGDVTINPSASCLVMTTEILRSMLYRGSEIMREVAWVIFDEIHYMRDAERGVVWEETIILLPRKVRYVFLSATIPNAMEFAEWIAHTHAQPCHVVYTDFRPTPLQHYLFPAGAEGIHLVVDERGVFREDNFQKAMGALGTAVGEDPASSTSGEGRKGKKGGQTRKGNKGQTGGVDSDIYKIVKMIMLKNYNPVIVFAFSKRECENLALSMAKLEFNTDEEKEMVSSVFTNAINALTEEDRTLPQIEHILPLLRRGIGIHHGGLLPILKEVIEILFQEGLIKVLFATETFSIGLNMPAKTVVFTAVRKFDGKAFRDLTSGEFIQMSGRAGRRGLDDRGIVIMMFDEKLEPAAAKNMVQGEADRLDSAFHLGYNMVLNLMRVEGVSPEYMLQRCFYQFQHAAKVPLLEAQMEEKIKLRDGMQVPREEEVSEVWTLRKQLRMLLDDKRLVISHPTYALSFLQPGRLIHVHYKSAELDLDFGWGVCAAFQKRLPAKGPRGAAELDDAPEHEHYIVDVLLRCAPGGLEALPKEKDSHGPGAKGIDWGRGQTLRPCTSIDGEGEMLVVPVLLSAVEAISGVRIKLPKDLTSKEERASVGSVLSEVEWRFTEADAEDKKRRKEEKDDKKFKKKSQKKDKRVKVRGEEERQRLQGEGANVVVLGGDMPLLDPIKDQRVTDEAFKTLLGKIDILETRLKSLERELSGGKPTILAELYKAYGEKDKLSGEIEGIRSQITAAESVLQLDELKCRKRVLRRLGFTDSDDVVQKKGRVACEISTGDELLLTEMIFNGVFNELTPEQCAALLSCFVFTEKSNQQTRLPEELAAPLRTMQESARRIALVQRESRLPVVEDEYVSSFKVELMDAVMQWCRGAKFAEVCKLTDVFEGSLIRTFRRLQELIRQMTAAAKAIGNEELEQKFTASQAKLERESSIIFSPSLYL